MQQYLDRLQDRYVDEPIKWATLGGLVLIVIGVFGSWASVNIAGLLRVSTNGFDHNGGLVFLLALVGLAAILVWTFAGLNVKRTQLLWGLVGVAAVIDLLVIFTFLDIATASGVRPGWGLWLTVVGAALCSAGAIVPMWGEIRSKADEMRGAGPES